MAHAYRVLDSDYPRSLRELRAPPDPLFVRGTLPRGRGVAIVGTRDCSDGAAAYAHRLATRLAEQGVVVYSGGAVGIDAAAHRGALEAGGITVAVVATGLDQCYPPGHAQLYEQIVREGGALVSAFAPDQKAHHATFHFRNGVLAALAEATVVVQAPLHSGARSTAAHARRLGRHLLVVPAAPWDPKGSGNLIELALGGHLLASDAAVLALFGIVAAGPPRAARPPRAPSAGERQDPQLLLPPACQRVFEAIGAVPLHVDDLCVRTGLSTPLVQEALLTLTLQTVLVEGPAGCYRRATY